jgi:hypothetical protein
MIMGSSSHDEVQSVLEKHMSVFAQGGVSPGKDALANTILDKLRGVALVVGGLVSVAIMSGLCGVRV